MERLLVMMAGAAGFAGVAAGAAARHLAAGEPAVQDLLETASRYLVLHALAILVAVALLPRLGFGFARGAGLAAGGLFAFGSLCFGGGIIFQVAARTHRLDLVIPVGGMALMFGWIAILIAGAGLVPQRRP